MKTESRGGSTAESTITRNLARLFGEELDRAERYFPTMRTPLEDALEGRRPRGRSRLRLAAQGIAVAAVAVIVAGGGWLAFGSSAALTGPGGPVSPTGSANLLGTDGIPNQIDGEHVYRVGESVESQKQGGFLLGGYVFQEVSNCPADAAPSEPCFGLGPNAGSDAATGGIDVAVAIEASDPNPPALGGWLGMPVVVRAKGCTWDNGTPCPPVVMAILWPTVPTKPSMGADGSSPASLVTPSANPPVPSTGVGSSSPNPGTSTVPSPTPRPGTSTVPSPTPRPGTSTVPSPTPNAS